MSDATVFRDLIESLAPEHTTKATAVIELSDACFGFEGGVSQAFGIPIPLDMPERGELRARCLELMHEWLPRLDLETLEVLEWRVKDRRTPIDLAARKAELEREAGLELAGHGSELAPFAELPPLAGFEPIGAMFIEAQIGIGESPADGIVLPARPGVWLAYVNMASEAREHDEDDDERDEDDDERDEDEPDQLLAVHAQALGQLDALRARAERTPDELPIHGARMAIADADAAKDQDFTDALYENREEDYRGRAAQVFLGGDGHAFANVARDGDDVVLVVVDMY